MKISIITPVFNEEKSLERYFKALSAVEYPIDSFEVIFVNDGSSDNSLVLLRKFQKKTKLRIKVINLKTNNGRAIARERGAKRAQFKYLFFLDCKCEIFPDALRQINEINYQPLIGNAMQKNDSIVDRFFYSIRH